jgi:hypothetical protein
MKANSYKCSSVQFHLWRCVSMLHLCTKSQMAKTKLRCHIALAVTQWMNHKMCVLNGIAVTSECSLEHSTTQHIYKFSKQLVLAVLISHCQMFSLSRTPSEMHLCKDKSHCTVLIKKRSDDGWLTKPKLAA